MKLRSYIILIAICSFSNNGYGQKLSIKESSALQRKLVTYFSKEFNESFASLKDPKAEGFLCELGVDTSGRIYTLNFLADAKYTGNGYSIFTKMNVEYFKDWSCKKCSNSSILIPVFVLPNGLELLEETRKGSGLAGFQNINSKRIIYIREAIVSWPETYH